MEGNEKSQTVSQTCFFPPSHRLLSTTSPAGSLSLAITHPQFYWYVDETLSPERLSSSLLRSEIHFGAPLPSFYSLQDRADEQRARFKDFVVQYADILAKQSTRSGPDSWPQLNVKPRPS